MTRSLTCPRCGTPMNHQANKLVEPTTREESESASVLGGLVVAVFACPNCGWIAWERAETEQD